MKTFVIGMLLAGSASATCPLYGPCENKVDTRQFKPYWAPEYTQPRPPPLYQPYRPLYVPPQPMVITPIGGDMFPKDVIIQQGNRTTICLEGGGGQLICQ